MLGGHFSFFYILKLPQTVISNSEKLTNPIVHVSLQKGVDLITFLTNGGRFIYRRLGSSDIDFFAIFENGHYAADQVYFFSPIPKYRRIWPRARRMRGKVFTFKNSQGP